MSFSGQGASKHKRAVLATETGHAALCIRQEVPCTDWMSANKESVISEKAMRVGFGQTIVVGYSDLIHSSQFPTFDDFASTVQKEWDQEWQRVYSSQPEDAKVQAPPEVDDRHHTRLTKALMVLVGSFSLVWFWTTVYWSARIGLLSMFGSLRPHVKGMLVVFLAFLCQVVSTKPAFATYTSTGSAECKEWALRGAQQSSQLRK
ncbi:hypothetical protein ABBQ38_013042 [Trebouxia sp. C0009 RCD-2024]